MKGLEKTAKMLGLGVLAITLVGCASAKKGGPEQAPAPAPVAGPAMGPAVAAASDDSYTVVTGDNLWMISGKSEIYNDVYQWPLIYKANSDQIKDADLIFPGQVLTIDRAATDADINAAINHAKTRGAWVLGETEASDTAFLGK